jgi:hypothetical protein
MVGDKAVLLELMTGSMLDMAQTRHIGIQDEEA